MSDELRALLLILAVSVAVGLAAGIALRKLRPEWCKTYAKFSLNRQWKLFAFGTVLFAVLGVLSFAQGRPYFGAFFVTFCGLELYAILRFGFKPLPPEMEKRINDSDPTKLLPLRFWKQKENG